MTNYRPPGKQGLYDPQFEHDACGIGVLTHIKGKKSHELVRQALDILGRLAHRGGQGFDTESGDGAGILTQIPHAMFEAACEQEGISLPSAGKYGVGMIFLPIEQNARMRYEARLEEIARQEGFVTISWRTVPVDETVLGVSAKKTMPLVRQWFVKPENDAEIQDDAAMERRLYVIRKQAEKVLGSDAAKNGHPFYFTSFSSRTIVYKGLMLPERVSAFYLDLANEQYQSAIALVHSRFSTNTFPSWERAHPNRYVIHNGEINTIKGNVNWMRARVAKCESDVFPDLSKVRPIIDTSGSDSSMLDNTVEFLTLSGRSLAHAMMMMVPEPWVKDPLMNEEKRAFYEYHSHLMEPWDGPAALAFSDGKQVGACLDRNGLRPSRYYVTKDDMLILSSETGVVNTPAEDILYKERLHPGQMLLVDTERGIIVPSEELKSAAAKEKPYKEWLEQNAVHLDQQTAQEETAVSYEPQRLLQAQRAFGYTFEEMNKVLKPLGGQGEDPVGSMGYDGPLAVLTDKPQLLYNYFKQMFAQVTNPPIDAFLEELVTSLETTIGPEGNLLKPGPENCRRIRLKAPVLSGEQFSVLSNNRVKGFKTVTLPMLFPAGSGHQGMEQALAGLFEMADKAIAEGAGLIILSDREMDDRLAPIPALLASAGLHHHLIRSGTRSDVSIIVDSGEPREVHHAALLLGYGANAVHPYLVYASFKQMLEDGVLSGVTYEDSVSNYIKGISKGLLKVIAKMGISTVQSYIGAQIFEALGIRQDVIDQYFTWTPSRLGGIGLETMADEVLQRHAAAFAHEDGPSVLEPGDDFQWRPEGEKHLYNPVTLHSLQHACRTGDYEMYRKYSESLEGQAEATTLRGMLEFASGRQAISIDEVEPMDSILRRFKSGAMSFGSISREAHETLAIAMNRIGGKSNSGEGGEEASRYQRDANGDSRSSAIKQVASGRFGVTSQYLSSAEEIQIKMAQGAKPGEGGQLPAHKVYPWIAAARGSTPGVELISPPPHHDIYSIEDLAELIYDLKNANPKARINVKLVSEAGVGTIAAGVAKAVADVILISGYDGGTGAAARGSIKHAGMPWEIGLAETHQTLVLNGLRSRVRLETDGKMMTGRDVVIAAMLGAEEFGFATVPLAVMGCVMMRVCHLDTCPVGIATQNPELRAKFSGKPEHVVNFMVFVAQEVREWMAKLGFRTLDEMVGRSDLLKVKETPVSKKAALLDLSALLYRSGEAEADMNVCFSEPQNHNLESTLDYKQLLPLAQPVWDGTAKQVKAVLPVHNTNRSVGTMLGHEVTRRHGAEGLPEDTIQLHFEGSAGQSFGAFVPRGITMTLEGDANDYIGKGLSGGKMAVYPSPKVIYSPEDNIIIGNAAFYGATSGEAYIRGVAGERFCVRNSGANVVVEGVGNHGCEYMTGGRVVILGEVGRNFAAGMSGGIAYVWNRSLDNLSKLCNLKLVDLEVIEDDEEASFVRGMLERHIAYTGSEHAIALLKDWDRTVRQFVRVIPREYKKIIQTEQPAGVEAMLSEY